MLELPDEYAWMLEHGLIGFEPFTQLEPWYFLETEAQFWLEDRWPGVSDKRLLSFARRQDNDDIACFICDKNTVTGIALVHGWTCEGFTVLEEYDNLWEWLKSVIGDIQEVADNASGS